MVIIRKLRKSDAPSVVSIIKRCLQQVNSKDYPLQVITFMCAYFTPEKIIENTQDRLTFVAVNNQQIVGTASLKENIVLTVFVDPKVHGTGVGNKLMEKVEHTAAKNGYSFVKVPSSITAFSFYKKRGYKKMKEKKEKNFGKVIIMKKMLKNQRK